MNHKFEIDIDKIEFSEYLEKAIKANDSEHFYIWIMTCVVLADNEIWGSGYDADRENVSIYNLPYFFNDVETIEAIEITKTGEQFYIDSHHEV